MNPYTCTYGCQCPSCLVPCESNPVYEDTQSTYPQHTQPNFDHHTQHPYQHHIPPHHMMQDQQPSPSAYEQSTYPPQHPIQPPAPAYHASASTSSHYLPQHAGQNYNGHNWAVMPNGGYHSHHQYPTTSTTGHIHQAQYPTSAFGPPQHGYMALGHPLNNTPVHQSYMPLAHQQLSSAVQHSFMPLGQQASTSVVQPAMTTFVSSAYGVQANSSSLTHYHSDLQNGLSDFGSHSAFQLPSQDMQCGHLGSSPTETYLDQHSASSSDCGWHLVDEASPRSSFESFPDIDRSAFAFTVPAPAVSNPGTTLHIRSDSSSTYEEVPMSASSLDGFENIMFPMESPAPAPAELPVATTDEPTSSEGSTSAQSSSEPSSPEQARSVPSTSPPSMAARTRPKRNSQGKASKPLTKKVHVSPKVEPDAVEKRGRRKGPLKPEQRRSAGEIRKIKACLRCKFLKKTCDTNEICHGCRPSHQRLWLVPCTRMDIKDLGFFLQDWHVDHERHQSYAIPSGMFKDLLVTGQPAELTQLYISHGYGFCFAVDAREVIFSNNKFSLVDWSEAAKDGKRDFNIATVNMVVSNIDQDLLNEYVDRHIGPKFPDFVRKHFQGTKFLSEMLLTAFNFWKKTGSRVVKTALKLLVAYNLTMQVAFVESPNRNTLKHGRVDNPSSRFHNKVIAPMLVSEAIKHAMARMWRELQKDVLSELSSLFHKVYTGDRQKNWPTIFIVATLLLAVWEEMQFDAHYREPDEKKVEKFCNDMESQPVGVIICLFQAISAKVPSFQEWDTKAHHHLLDSNEAACDVMTEVREHVNKHEDYMRDRAKSCSYDPDDFDSLSNKFLSQLVIKPGPAVK